MGKSSASIALPVAPAGSVSRLLKPSLSDILFVAVIVWSFLSSGGWSPLLMDGDTGFHIRVGDWIREHQQVPVTHPFSFSVTGKDWFAFEWLSQVSLSWLHSEFGLKGVTLASGVLIAAVFTVLFRFTVRQGANPLIAAVLTLLAANTARIHFWARPHLFTWLFLVIAIWLMERERRSPSRWTWTLVPLTILWANTHGGFILFFVLLALLAGVLAVQALWGKGGWQPVRRLSLIGGVSLAATTINPYGLHLPAHVAEVVSAGWLRSAVDEFKSPSFRSEPLMIFMALLFVSLMLCWRLFTSGRWVEAVWIVFLAYSSLAAVRQVPIFALVAAPIVAVELSGLWSGFVLRSSAKSVPRILDDVASRSLGGTMHTSVLPLLFVAGLASLSPYTCAVRFPAESFPTAMVEAHSADLAGARVFTTDQWSDYLIYRNYPQQRSFIDGQHQYYGESHVRDYLDVLEGRSSWSAVMDRFHFDYVLCPPTSPVASLLRNSNSGWKQVDEDKQSVLFAATRR